ncbi:MAG: cobalamin synthesis protein [Rubrobacteraceae bacterium]|nr:cobalamin synthesis protein [Rubrobacteraceae bacterium]
MKDRDTRRPVTIVTGFLGSGKTTLLARVLSEPLMANTAVLVNEFGEVGLDHHLLRRVDERTVLLGSGCVCCTTREDLVGALMELLDMDQRGEMPTLERVVIETTGLADPAPILHTIYTDPVLQHHFLVDLVLATVDAVNGVLHLDRNPESVKQVAAADKVVVTKTDIAEPGIVRRLLSRLGTINPSALTFEAAFGEVDVHELFRPYGVGTHAALTFLAGKPDEPHDVGDTYSVSVTFDGPIDWTAFGIWFSMLLNARGEDVLRVKGLLDVGEAGPVVLNGVQHIIHPPQHLGKWPDEDHRSRIIFITRGIRPEELLDSLLAFRGLLGARPLPLHAEQTVPFP